MRESDIIINSKAHSNIVMKYFSAKVGRGEIRETCKGSYGIGTRNRRGDASGVWLNGTNLGL